MSSRVCSYPTIRAAQSFTASAVKQPVRRLHITGAKDSPSQYLKPASAVARSKTSSQEAPARTFNTSRALKRPNDSSTIDFAFMPEESTFAPGTVSTAALNIPILPDNYRSAPLAAAVAPAPHVSSVAAEVETVSMAMPGQVAVMSESDVGATHEGREMDVFKMVEALGRNVREAEKVVRQEASTMGELWRGMVEDVVGRGSSRAA